MLSGPLANLINYSICSGVFPDCSKRARIVPIFKKRDTENTSNYRPITLLPTISKIFEVCISIRLISFLDKSNIIINRQFGFLEGRSTTDAFVALTEYVYNCLNNKEHCIGICIDFQKVFDTVNHRTLLTKLESYGVRGLPLQWLTSYLGDRRQMATLNGHCSSEKSINVGVPQGSKLGPILFSVYINDLPKVSSTFWSVLYADDTTLLIGSADYAVLMETVNRSEPKVHDWCIANRLSLSMDKTYAMVFTNRHNAVTDLEQIYMCNTPVKLKETEEFLGLGLDNEL